MTQWTRVYCGIAQFAAWSTLLLVWIAPISYAITSWFIKKDGVIEGFYMGVIEGFYMGVGAFVVLREFQRFAQREADGDE